MFKKRNNTFIIGLIAASLLPACGASVPEEPSQSDQPVVYGWKTTHSNYKSIAALTNVFKKPFCTATLVMPDALITAAHCVYDADPEMFYVSYGAGDPENESLNTFHKPFVAVTHPSYGWKDQDCDKVGRCKLTDENAWDDVALVILKEPIKDPTCAPILLPERYDDLLKIGATVRIAGYGQNWVEDFGPLYAGDVPLLQRSKFEIDVGLDEVGATGACFGDSGGPAYVHDGENVAVAGITSRSSNGPVCGKGSIYSMPGSYIEWFAASYLWLTCVRDSGNTPAPDACDPDVAANAVLKTCEYQKTLQPTQPTAKKPDAGSSTGGSTSSGGTSAGGTGGTGGSVVVVGGTGGSTPVVDDESGCGCVVGRNNNSNSNLAFVGLLGAFASIVIRSRKR